MIIVDDVITRYNKVKKDLRFDGEYLNYFAAILSVINKNYINYDKIKLIRKKISVETSWHSSFRGTGLYIISIILSFKEDFEQKIEKIISIEEKLVSHGFKESSYLALASYILEKSKNEKSVEEFIGIYDVIHKKSSKITCDEDYPMIALMVYKEIHESFLTDKYEDYFSTFNLIETKSSNVVQDMVISSMIFNNEVNINNFTTKEKIESQYALLYPIFFKKSENTVNILDLFEDKLEDYIELQLFMDSSFRRFLSMTLLLVSSQELNNEDLEVLISLCILNFTKTQETSVLSGLV